MPRIEQDDPLIFSYDNISSGSDVGGPQPLR